MLDYKPFNNNCNPKLLSFQNIKCDLHPKLQLQCDCIISFSVFLCVSELGLYGNQTNVLVMGILCGVGLLLLFFSDIHRVVKKKKSFWFCFTDINHISFSFFSFFIFIPNLIPILSRSIKSSDNTSVTLEDHKSDVPTNKTVKYW